MCNSGELSDHKGEVVFKFTWDQEVSASNPGFLFFQSARVPHETTKMKV